MHVKKTALFAATAVAALAVPAAAMADYGHVVLPGESLSSIAAADGLSVAALAAANGLSPTSGVEVGHVVYIPPQTAATSASAASNPAVAASAGSPGDSTGAVHAVNSSASATSGYLVQPGDTLSGIAARIGTSVSQLAALNGLSPDGVLLIGKTLQLPSGGSSGARSGSAEYVSTSSASSQAGASSQAASGSSAGPATGTGNQQIPGATNSGPYPTAETVPSGQVGSEASIDGVDPAFAEAIADQESGFNNDLVSPTGAVGVMQIEPATWSWINQALAKPGAPLNPSSAYGNVAGGARLLHNLVARTGSDAMAAAAYYQGLQSVEEHGLYPSTQQYVNDVMALEQRFGG